MLIPKAKGALEKYRHQLVIGNILERRKKKLYLVSEEDELPIILTDEEIDEGKEIEEKLVGEVTKGMKNTSKGTQANLKIYERSLGLTPTPVDRKVNELQLQYRNVHW